MLTTQNSLSQILIIYCMKLKLEMAMKILAALNEFLPLVIMQPSQNIVIIQSNCELWKGWCCDWRIFRIKNKIVVVFGKLS